MAKQYVDLIKDIDEIEKASTKVDLNQIDISEIQSTQMQHPKPDFKAILDSAMRIESGKAIEQQQAQRQKQQQPKQVAQMQAAVRAAQAQATVMVAPEPLQQKPVQQVQVQQPQPPKPSLSESVKGEISNFTSKLTQSSEPPHQPINTFKMQIEGEDDLILPKLSASDQISELERIMEGLQQNAFDKEHMAIVKKEAYGLSKAIARERKRGIYGGESSGMEQSLILIRDQRLSEVIAILSGAG